MGDVSRIAGAYQYVLVFCGQRWILTHQHCERVVHQGKVTSHHVQLQKWTVYFSQCCLGVSLSHQFYHADDAISLGILESDFSTDDLKLDTGIVDGAGTKFKPLISNSVSQLSRVVPDKFTTHLFCVNYHFGNVLLMMLLLPFLLVDFL